MKSGNRSSVVFSVMVFGLLTLASAHTGEDDFSHHTMMGGYGGVIFGWMFGLLVVVALVLLIVWLIKEIQKK